MRVSLGASTALLAVSCASHQKAIASLALSCAAPSTATRFDPSRVEQLAGVYAVTLQADSFPAHGARAFGRLRLGINSDTLHTVAARPLVGILEMNLDAVFAPYSHDPRSTAAQAPGVYFEAGAFEIGVQPNLNDGTSTSLTPELVWPEGFQGRWDPHYGIAQVLNPATGKPAHVGGEFCAVRTR